MSFLSVLADGLCGWIVWSLSHNLGHRWWHVEMLHGKETPYAHGEREHHRVYDSHGARAWQMAEDPQEKFISFPLIVIAIIGILFVAGFGWLRGWSHCAPFAIGLYGCMVLDHQLHILFHKSAPLSGPLGLLQRMHMIHHQTHSRNYFFVTGVLWDVLFRTAQTTLEPAPKLVPVDAPKTKEVAA